MLWNEKEDRTEDVKEEPEYRCLNSKEKKLDCKEEICTHHIRKSELKHNTTAIQIKNERAPQEGETQQKNLWRENMRQKFLNTYHYKLNPQT